MTMATKCTSCGTTFRVTPEQLKAHHGRVRCGHCMTVFDGLGNLVTLPDVSAPASAPAAAPAPVSVATLMPPPESPPELEAHAPPGESVQAPAGAVPPEALGEESAATAASEPEPFELEPVTEPLPERVSVAEEVIDVTPVPTANLTAGLPFDEPTLHYPQAPRRRWPWAIAALLAFIALLAQAAYFFRTDIAARYPPLKPLLVKLCEYANCRVALPQQPKLINIEASDLQAVDPTRPGLIRVTATLRNHANHDLGYPALDLVLTNTRDHALARRIFMPEHYLDRGRDPALGIPAKGELTIRIDVETGDLGAAGFRLDLLAAPAR